MGCGDAMKRVCRGGGVFDTGFESSFKDAVEFERASSRSVVVEEEAVGCGGREGVLDLIDWRYWIMLKIFPGFEERVMIVVTPAEVAKRAATILVDIPPVPRREPADETVLIISIDSGDMYV